jgi:hypothetical protein
MAGSELQALSAPTPGVTVACQNGNVRAWSDDFEPTPLPPGRFLGVFFRISGDALKPRPRVWEGNKALEYDDPKIGWAGKKKK